jgi:hypothetical protein
MYIIDIIDIAYFIFLILYTLLLFYYEAIRWMEWFNYLGVAGEVFEQLILKVVLDKLSFLLIK